MINTYQLPKSLNVEFPSFLGDDVTEKRFMLEICFDQFMKSETKSMKKLAIYKALHDQVYLAEWTNELIFPFYKEIKESEPGREYTFNFF